MMAEGRTADGAHIGVPARAAIGTTVIEHGFSLLAAGKLLGLAQRWLTLALPSAAVTALVLVTRDVTVAAVVHLSGEGTTG